MHKHTCNVNIRHHYITVIPLDSVSVYLHVVESKILDKPKKAVHGRVPLQMSELNLLHNKVFSMAGF